MSRFPWAFLAVLALIILFLAAKENDTLAERLQSCTDQLVEERKER